MILKIPLSLFPFDFGPFEETESLVPVSNSLSKIRCGSSLDFTNQNWNVRF